MEPRTSLRNSRTASRKSPTGDKGESFTGHTSRFLSCKAHRGPSWPCVPAATVRRRRAALAPRPRVFSFSTDRDFSFSTDRVFSFSTDRTFFRRRERGRLEGAREPSEGVVASPGSKYDLFRVGAKVQRDYSPFLARIHDPLRP